MFLRFLTTVYLSRYWGRSLCNTSRKHCRAFL